MYLKNIWLENTGPISKLEIELPFDERGNPKPIVIVGGNGSGKTVLLSYIADALVELAKTAFQDIVPGQGVNSPYLRVVGGTNTKLGSQYSLSILQFKDINEINSEYNIIYREQVGSAPPDWNEKCQLILNKTLPWSDGSKELEGQIEEKTEKIFTNNSICFFPYNRSERPHWYNPDVVEDINDFDTGKNFRKKLKHKPIIITETASKNQSWLLHLFLDSRADFDLQYVNQQINFILRGQQGELIQRRGAISNIESLLKQILNKSNIRLALLPRANGLSRICVVENNEVIIPSLDHLSTGQALLFNMFMTIIRYADRADNTKSTALSNIKGIVLIDEIDSHIHADLQYNVLPNLIKIFPKVQFIVTSHAPPVCIRN
ncbi:AAA family ATPase [Hymenobacter psychrotolerans]|uniref:AAA domain-containing protein, putative AbiEii toxin, Type IV TA system n=1 Tax=Hymenobacter psychrotolerans DSM 18569 TaxID=1121959 RepID=A0A1M6X922_9BACT|nr:AAA family ATPase [Hymenobacter psychrotolerans]SHL02477.1 AAA domain-containing protein, putative AbiEii toxin, Type IV TA system [Hymenobacter psychrotolerans DSM 18569]